MAPSRPPRPPARPARDPKELLKKRGADLIRKVSDKDRYGIFLEPVDVKEVNNYTDFIERPMDLSTAQKNLQMGVYRTPMELRADLDLIWSNCCTFNLDDSIYYKEAVRLRALATRHYDDMVRALSRDGVAASLGLSSARENGPNSSRTVGKRPPRHRLSAAHSGGAHSSSLITSEPTSPEGDADASASASPSASASAGTVPFRDAQIRRAQAAAETAAAAAAEAEQEARAAAIAAGVAPPAASSTTQIFAGPGGVLHRSGPGVNAVTAANFRTLNQKKVRKRCGEIPVAWRRIGRWHTRGASMSKFNSRARALDVHYGRIYSKFVHKSAPLARRILATVLDAEAVRQHDQSLISQQAGQTAPNGVLGTTEKNGRLSHGSGDGPAKRRSTPQNGRNMAQSLDGPSDPMALDDSSQANWMFDRTQDPATSCQWVYSIPLVASGNVGAMDPRPSKGEQFVRKVLSRGSSEVAEEQKAESGKQQRLPSRRALARLQLLLKEKGVDSSFLGSLVKEVSGAGSGSPQASSLHGKGPEDAIAKEMDCVLQANHAALMNVLRLRALRETANEADREDLEDRERECVEGLAKGMALAVKNVPPRHVIHPDDAAESALALCQSVLPPQSQK